MLLIPLKPDEPETDIKIILNRYIEAVKKVNRSNKSHEFIEQTISLGCVIIPPETKRDINFAEKIKEQADRALYKSKTAGKSRFTITTFQLKNNSIG